MSYTDYSVYDSKLGCYTDFPCIITYVPIIQPPPQKGNKMTQPNPPKDKKLLDQYRDAIELKHYSPRTGDTYIGWVKEYLYFHNDR